MIRTLVPLLEIKKLRLGRLRIFKYLDEKRPEVHLGPLSEFGQRFAVEVVVEEKCYLPGGLVDFDQIRLRQVAIAH